MLLNQAPSSRSGKAWILFLALSPLAYLFGVLFLYEQSKSLDLGFSLDREAMIARTRDFAAASLGITTVDWQSYTAAQADDALLAYYRMARNDERKNLRQLAPPVVVRVLFVSPDGNEALTVRLAPDGRVLGYSHRPPADSSKAGSVRIGGASVSYTPDSPPGGREKLPVHDSGDEAMLVIAREALGRRSEAISFLELGNPEVKTARHGEILARTYTWKTSPKIAPELKLEFEIEVRGNTVVSDVSKASLDSSFVSRDLDDAGLLRNILKGVLAVAAAIIGIYALIRYVRRTQQKEISHKRSFTLAVIVGLSFLLVALTSVLDTVAIEMGRTEGRAAAMWVAGIAITFAYLFIGLLVGVFWGSAEGDVREAFPGKLTSLDALTVGKVFSRNVGQALILGIAFGGWALLLATLVRSPWRDAPHFGDMASNHVVLFYTRLQWLLALMSPVISSVTIAVLGLLLPLMLTYRTFGSSRLRAVSLALLAALGCSWIGLQIQPFVAGVLVTIVTAACLLVSFFVGDLLTSMVALGAYSFVSYLVHVASRGPGVRGSLIFSGLVALAGVAFGIFAWLRGRRYREDEVRPLYAKHLAERQSLQAEVSAARQAQQRLGPQTVPMIEGLTLAASCRQAEGVGGDFYDFFPITPSKLGIFLAEGGGSGLFSALSIAFAKGLLMPMVARVESPTEVIARLHAALNPLLSNSNRIGLLYAVVDTAAGTLRYARFGSYPRLLVSRPGCPASVATETECEIDSQDVSPNALECRTVLVPGDNIVLFTDGLAETLAAAEKVPADEWLLSFLSSRREASAGEIHRALMEALRTKIKRARRNGVDDDLSTIVLRFGKQAELTREEVA
jgi:phosphoserine phosphatase RsbU/P